MPTEQEVRAGWVRDAQVVQAVVEHWRTDADVEVSVPRAFAEHAVAAWDRDDTFESEAVESDEQRHVRSGAAVLALVGLCLQGRGRWGEDEVWVRLPMEYVEAMVRAAAPPAD